MTAAGTRDDGRDMARAAAFEEGMRERAATQRAELPWGIGLFDPRFARVMDMNCLYLRDPDRSLTATHLIADADRIMDERNISHRQIETRVDVGGWLEPQFLDAGWSTFHGVWMALRRAPDHPPSGDIDVGEITWDELRPTVRAAVAESPWASDEEIIMQLTDRHPHVATVTHQRAFGARVAGEIVSSCFLYSDGATAQVEIVHTLEAYRGRGLARAAIGAAVDLAQAEGHDFIFLVADADDWPKALYGKLGFDPVGYLISYRLEASKRAGLAEEGHPRRER